MICPKVRLADLFTVPNESGAQAHRNRIDRKHVDFLLCHPQSMKPLLAIELDDASHSLPTRQDRDALVDRVFATAGLPSIHVPCKRGYTLPELQALLAPHLPEKP